MSGKGNEAYEALERAMLEKFGHLVQRAHREKTWEAFVARGRSQEFPAFAPEQELADDYERNDHT